MMAQSIRNFAKKYIKKILRILMKFIKRQPILLRMSVKILEKIPALKGYITNLHNRLLSADIAETNTKKLRLTKTQKKQSEKFLDELKHEIQKQRDKP